MKEAKVNGKQMRLIVRIHRPEMFTLFKHLLPSRGTQGPGIVID